MCFYDQPSEQFQNSLAFSIIPPFYRRKRSKTRSLCFQFWPNLQLAPEQNQILASLKQAGSVYPPLVDWDPEIENNAIKLLTNAQLDIFIGLTICFVELLSIRRYQNPLFDRREFRVLIGGAM